jgi:hypothetical protein
MRWWSQGASSEKSAKNEPVGVEILARLNNAHVFHEAVEISTGRGQGK